MLRQIKGMTIKELSSALGLDASSLYYIEQNKRGFSMESLIRACDFFDVSADFMIGRTDKQASLPLAYMQEYSNNDFSEDMQGYFRKTKLGYVQVYMPESPMAGKDGWAFLHRIVMAKSIGRDLRPEEVVHHVDGNPSNNARSNLMLFANNAEHRRYHGKMSRDRQIEELINQ